MLREFMVLAAVLGGSAHAAPKANPFDRFDKGDLIVTNPRGDLLYKREYPTMAACLHAKAMIDSQRAPRRYAPGDLKPLVDTSSGVGPNAICVPH